MRISMLSCNVPVRPAYTFTWISSSVLHPVHQSHNCCRWFADWLAQVWLHTFHGSINQPCNLAGISQIVQVAFTAAHLWSLTKKTSEFVWSSEHQSAVDCQERDHNPYFAAIPWQYPASYWSGVFRGNRRHLRKLVNPLSISSSTSVLVVPVPLLKNRPSFCYRFSSSVRIP